MILSGCLYNFNLAMRNDDAVTRRWYYQYGKQPGRLFHSINWTNGDAIKKLRGLIEIVHLGPFQAPRSVSSVNIATGATNV